MRQLAPGPLSNLPHISVLLHGAICVAGILGFVSTPESHHREAADDKSAAAEYDKEDDEGWGNLEAHVVSFVELEVHGGGGVTVSLSKVYV